MRETDLKSAVDSIGQKKDLASLGDLDKNEENFLMISFLFFFSAV